MKNKILSIYSNHKQFISMYLLIFIPLIVVFLSIGYSAFGTKMNISSVAIDIRLNIDTRITGITATSATSEGVSSYEDYDRYSFSSGIALPNEDSSVTYKIEITNFSNVETGILSINNLPENLEYELKDYSLHEKICDSNNECKLGIKKEFYMTIKYKEGGYNSEQVNYYINPKFNFKSFYNVEYEDIIGNYPKEAMAGSDFSVTLDKDTITSGVKVTMNGIELSKEEYSVEGNTLKINNVSGNIIIKGKLYTDGVMTSTNSCIIEGTCEKGTKVNVKVKDNQNYNFYVLEDTGTKLTLIMDRNYTDDEVPKTMAWCNQSGSNPSDNICNHDGLDPYIEKIQAKFGSEVTVGIPSYEQMKRVECSNTNGSCPQWAYDYLDGTPNSVSGVYGYWTSTGSSSISRFARIVSSSGRLNEVNVSVSRSPGLRPTIEVRKKEKTYTNGIMESMDNCIIEGTCEKGTKVNIKVNDNQDYNFYVLEDDGTKLSLIMDRNICSDGSLATSSNTCLVSWISQEDYNDDNNFGWSGNTNKGPITAMNYLYSATKNWSNVPNIKMNYTNEDTNGYGGITTSGSTTRITNKSGTVTATYENLKSRMPELSEMEETGCTSSSGSCPGWMVNGLRAATNFYPEGSKEDIEGIYGYWSSTSAAANAWYVRSNGFTNQSASNGNLFFGVRPVIEIKKKNEKICNLVEGASKEVGSKYTCELDEDRTFYVLENNSSSDEITLLMDRNYADADVPKTMTWCNQSGPNSNNNACNHDGLDPYVERVQEKFGSEVKVGIPSYDQIYAVNNKGTLTSTKWLYDYLNGTPNPVSGVDGYWTSTGSSSISSSAWFVYRYGTLNGYYVDNGSRSGLRPVITISKSDLS